MSRLIPFSALIGAIWISADVAAVIVKTPVISQPSHRNGETVKRNNQTPQPEKRHLFQPYIPAVGADVDPTPDSPLKQYWQNLDSDMLRAEVNIKTEQRAQSDPNWNQSHDNQNAHVMRALRGISGRWERKGKKGSGKTVDPQVLKRQGKEALRGYLPMTRHGQENSYLKAERAKWEDLLQRMNGSAGGQNTLEQFRKEAQELKNRRSRVAMEVTDRRKEGHFMRQHPHAEKHGPTKEEKAVWERLSQMPSEY